MVSLSDHSSARANRTVVVAAALLLLIGLLGVWLVFRFVNSERERELQQWQIRLGIVAESRAAAISEWVETQYETLNDLAENASLQLYLTELMLVQGDRALVTDVATGEKRVMLVKLPTIALTLDGEPDRVLRLEVPKVGRREAEAVVQALRS